MKSQIAWLAMSKKITIYELEKGGYAVQIEYPLPKGVTPMIEHAHTTVGGALRRVESFLRENKR